MTDPDAADSGAYALHALPPDERAAFERHLATCDSCGREARDLQETVALLGATLAQEPPPELRARVLAHIATVRQLPPEAQSGAPAEPVVLPSPRRPALARVRPRALVAVAAALLLLTLGLTGVVVAQQQRVDDLAEAARIERIVTDPGRVTVSAQESLGGALGTAIVARGEALVLVDGMAPAPPGRAYQLWVIGPGSVRSAGLLEVADGRATQVVAGVTPADQLGLTVEPSGGSPAPTTQPIWQVEV